MFWLWVRLYEIILSSYLLCLEDLNVSAAHVLVIVLEALLDVPQRVHLNEGSPGGAAVTVFAEVHSLDAAIVKELDDFILAGAEGESPHPDDVVFLSHVSHLLQSRFYWEFWKQ